MLYTMLKRSCQNARWPRDLVVIIRTVEESSPAECVYAEPNLTGDAAIRAILCTVLLTLINHVCLHYRSAHLIVMQNAA